MSAEGRNPIPGEAQELEPGLVRVLAPNPSPMTFRGTNTYIVGRNEVMVIDPGPSSTPHLNAVLAAIGRRRVSHILVTHAHLDHSALAPRLSEATGADVLAFGDATAGRSSTMAALADRDGLGGGEGVDRTFRPDIFLSDDAMLSNGEVAISCLHTPGHMGNHMCFAWGGSVFTGDLIMGWASSLVSPPDGDLSAFLESCHRLRARHDRVFYAGHGDPITNPVERIGWLIRHRMERETQILDALRQSPATPKELTSILYHDLPAGLLPAAERNVLAHLIRLEEDGRVDAAPAPLPDATFSLK